MLFLGIESVQQSPGLHLSSCTPSSNCKTCTGIKN